MGLGTRIENFIWFAKKKIYCKQLERNKGFFDNGIHHITKTHYDLNGYDINGFDKIGYDKNNFDKNGFDHSGYNKNLLDRDGFNKEGIHFRTKLTRDEFSTYGFSIHRWYKEKRDLELQELKEKIAKKPKGNFNEYDFDENGFHKYLGVNIEGFNRDGFDKDGFDIDGWDKYGFNKDGIHIITGKMRDREGYDKEGLNNYEADRDGVKFLEYYPSGSLTKEKVYKRLAENYSLASQLAFKQAWDQYISENEDVLKRVSWANKRIEFVPYEDEPERIKDMVRHILE